MSRSKEWDSVPEEQREIILKHQSSFPIKVGAIAKDLGLDVKSSTLKAGISGEIKEVEGTVFIKISRHDSKERQRFTLAHEIAHFLLHKDKLSEGIEDTVLFRSNLSDKLEVEANKLAADIVMPLSLINAIDFPNDTKFEVKVERIANLAQLSIPAIEIRLGKKVLIMFDENFPYKYCPILSISPSEITGLKELPEKDKDLILPIFPIKSWATSKKLTDAIAKVESAIGKNRKWIADIDHEELLNRSLDKFRDVHKEIKRLTIPDNGYKYWCDFIVENPNTIPCLQLKVLTELQTQIKVLSSLNRGIVIILRRSDIESQAYMEILTQLRQTDNLLILLDLEQITNEQVGLHEQIKLYLIAIKQILPNALVSLSSTSFPDSFGGYYKGTKNIYERRLYEILKADVDDLIYITDCP